MKARATETTASPKSLTNQPGLIKGRRMQLNMNSQSSSYNKGNHWQANQDRSFRLPQQMNGNLPYSAHPAAAYPGMQNPFPLGNQFQHQHPHLDVNRLQVEHPYAMHLIHLQQNQLDQNFHQLNKAITEIQSLRRELDALREEKKKKEDKIPPVILVNKDEISDSDKDTVSLVIKGVSTKKEDKSGRCPIDGDATCTGNTLSTVSNDARPLKKRARRNGSSKSLPDYAKVMATLAAATSPSFKMNGTSKFVF